MNSDYYPPGFDQSLLDEDDTEEREAKQQREEDDANFADQEPERDQPNYNLADDDE